MNEIERLQATIAVAILTGVAIGIGIMGLILRVTLHLVDQS